MAITSFYNQTISLSPQSGHDAYGRERFTTEADYNARVQVQSMTKLMPNGQVKQIDAVMYISPEVAIDYDDKVTYDDTDYKVVGINEQVDGKGDVHHLKVQLALWV